MTAEAPQTPPSPVPPNQRPSSKLPVTLQIAIAALAVICVLVLIALFTGNMESHGSQVTVTVLYFAVFVGVLIGSLGLSSRAPSFPLPLAVIADILLLVYGMTLTWVSWAERSGYSIYGGSRSWMSNQWFAFWMLIPVLVLFAIPVFIAWGGARLSRNRQILHVLSTTLAVLMSGLAVMSAFPPLIERSFGLTTTQTYWNVTLSIWIVALALIAVYSLLLWFYGREDRLALRAFAHSASMNQGAGWPQAPIAPMAPAASYGTPHAQVHETTPVTELTPWPFAEDGVTPLPAGPDGLPVFSVLRPFDGRPFAVQAGDPEADAAIQRGRFAAGR